MVDAEIFGLSPYGGLVRYWTHLLNGLARQHVPVELVRPPRARAPIPELTDASESDAERWLFHPTYLASNPRPVEATVLTVHDTIYEDFIDGPTGRSRRDDLRRKRDRIEVADMIIVPSETTLEAFRKHYPGCRAALRVVAVGNA